MSDPGPLHMLYPYAGAQQYLDGALAYIEQARAADAAVVIAAPPERSEALADRVGASATVAFLDIASLGRNPARLLAAWQQYIDQRADGRTVRGINDTTPIGADTRYSGEARYAEWLLNRAFAGSDTWSLLCPIDTDAHSAPDVEALARCHPLVWNGTAHTMAVDYLTGPYALDELPDPPSQAQHLSYRLESLGYLRAAVAAFARSHALPANRIRDLILVISELATNSIRYGGGGGSAHLWREGDALACEFRDDGVISDPLVGRLRPSGKHLGGRGLWFVNQLCDLVQLRSEPERGTRVRIWFDLAATDNGEHRDPQSTAHHSAHAQP